MFYKDLAIYLSCGLPSFSSSYSLVLSLQNKWQACQERGRNFPRLFMKWQAPSSFSPIGTLSSTRNTIITLSVPLPALTTQKLVLWWWGCLCHSEPVQHSHHLHCAPCPRQPLQVWSKVGHSFTALLPWETAGVQGCWQSPVWAFWASLAPWSSLEEERCHLCFHPGFIWLSGFSTFTVKKTSTQLPRIDKVPPFLLP